MSGPYNFDEEMSYLVHVKKRLDRIKASDKASWWVDKKKHAFIDFSWLLRKLGVLK